MKNSIYALPAKADTQESFQCLLHEVHKGGGEGMVCESRLVEGWSDARLQALFDQARDADYAAIAQELRVLAGTDAGTDEEQRQQYAQLRRRFSAVVGIDFFGAHARHANASLLAELEARFATGAAVAAAHASRPIQSL